MNKNDLVKNLKKEIQDIYSKINEFENSEQIHLIDIDLALSKVRNLYELLSKLNTTSAYNTDNQIKDFSTKTKQVEKEKALVEEKPQVQEEVVHKPVELKEEKEVEKETEIEEAKEPELIIEKPNKPEPKKNENSVNHTDFSPEIVADKFHSKKFVHDNISQKNVKKDVSTKMQTKPIKDINSAIGLNDKFIFIRELFGGDKDHYHETIQILNNFDTYENAIGFLNENFEWEDDDSNFERLKELVHRKFA